MAEIASILLYLEIHIRKTKLQMHTDTLGSKLTVYNSRYDPIKNHAAKCAIPAPCSIALVQAGKHHRRCHPCLEGSTAAPVYFDDQSNKVRKSKANISQKNFLGLDDQCES